jgi:ParB-like chromosome segregation protein Spo0J
LAHALARLRDGKGHSQKEIARLTGKSEGEVSKLLSILELDPEAQAVVRNDTTGRLSKRHLYALSRVPLAAQPRVLERIQDSDLSAVDVERIADRERKCRETPGRRGAQYSRRRFKTSGASVLFTFRGDVISDRDILDAVDEIRGQLEADQA